MTEEDERWLVLRVPDVDPESFELHRMSRLLNDLSSALFAIARKRIGVAVDRPGPRTPSEERVAAFRLVRIDQGSLVIEMAPPPSQAQGRLAIPDDTLPEDVAFDFYETLKEVTTDQIPPTKDREIVRRVISVVEDFSTAGPTVEIKFRPRFPERFPNVLSELTATVSTRNLPTLVVEAPRRQRRTLIGHTFMVDVEPGKERLRLKLPDGRDITLLVDESVARQLESAINRPIEVEIEEEIDGDTTTRRVIQQIDMVSEPSAIPPKTIAELEAEQSLPTESPDYIRLATAVWPTEQDVEEFEVHIQMIRHAASN